MVWRIGWKIGGKIGQWERTIGRSDWILKNRMESEGLWHVRLDQMDRIRLFISIILRNALWDKYNKNRIRSVGQWERKIGWDLSKHESHPITFVNTNAFKLFKIGQWDAGFSLGNGAVWLRQLDEKSWVQFHPITHPIGVLLIISKLRNRTVTLRELSLS